jgi:hypothetical protein
VGGVFYLPDFVHFSPLGQQITENKKSTIAFTTIYTLAKIGADKSGVARHIRYIRQHVI